LGERTRADSETIKESGHNGGKLEALRVGNPIDREEKGRDSDSEPGRQTDRGRNLEEEFALKKRFMIQKNPCQRSNGEMRQARNILRIHEWRTTVERGVQPEGTAKHPRPAELSDF